MFKFILKVISLVFVPLLLNASIFNEAAIDKIGSKTYHDLKTRYEQKNAYIMSKPSSINAMKRSRSLSKLQIRAKTEDRLSLIIWVQEEFYPSGILTKKALQEQNEKLSDKHRDIIYKLGLINSKYHTKAKAMTKYPYIFIDIEAQDFDKILDIEGISKITEIQDRKRQLTESIPIIGADTAWVNGFSGAGQTIAVIDEGIKTSHKFFDGKVVFEGCFSGGNESVGYQSLCPSGDANSTAVGSACADARDDCSHGTAVAGAAVGKDEANSIFGVAKDASLIAIQTGSFRESDSAIISRGQDQLHALAKVIELKDQYKIVAVNMSSGYGDYNAACDNESGYTFLIDSLRSNEIAFIATTGNDYNADGIHDPACVSGAIAVGSTNDQTKYIMTYNEIKTRYYFDDSVASHTDCDDFSVGNDVCLFNQFDIVSAFSNSAPIVDLLAPGAKIMTADASNNDYDDKVGTSFAAPQVAGAFAVIKSANPNLSIDEIEALLKSTGKLITDDAKAPAITKPRIDIAKALDVSLYNPNGINIAIFGSHIVLIPSNEYIKNYLLKTGRFKSIDIFNTGGMTPTLAQLQEYDAVLVYSLNSHNDPATLGNNLAAYVDGGGGVVTAMYSNDSNRGISGAFNFTFLGGIDFKNYWAIKPSDGSESDAARSLNAIILTHPILEDITALDATMAAPINNLHTEAIRVANWSDGTPLIVTRDIEGVRRVDIGFTPTNTTLTSASGGLTKDGDLVIANALEWVANKFNGSLVPITGYLLFD